MTDWPIISTVTFLPLVGVLLILRLELLAVEAVELLRFFTGEKLVFVAAGLVRHVVLRVGHTHPTNRP